MTTDQKNLGKHQDRDLEKKKCVFSGSKNTIQNLKLADQEK